MREGGRAIGGRTKGNKLTPLHADRVRFLQPSNRIKPGSRNQRKTTRDGRCGEGEDVRTEETSYLQRVKSKPTGMVCSQKTARQTPTEPRQLKYWHRARLQAKSPNSWCRKKRYQQGRKAQRLRTHPNARGRGQSGLGDAKLLETRPFESSFASTSWTEG